jgi:YD repeat-containing protein
VNTDNWIEYSISQFACESAAPRLDPPNLGDGNEEGCGDNIFLCDLDDPTQGDPVSVRTGDFLHEAEGLTLSGPNVGLDVRMMYTTDFWKWSATGYAWRDMPLGWNVSLNRTLVVYKPPGRQWCRRDDDGDGVVCSVYQSPGWATIVWENGRHQVMRETVAGSGLYGHIGPTGAPEVMEMDDGRFVHFVGNGSVQVFDANGVLSSMTDFRGNTIRVEHFENDAGGYTRVATIEATGQAVWMTWTPVTLDDGSTVLRLTEISDAPTNRPPGARGALRVVRMEYDGQGQLVTHRDVMGEPETYGYDDAGRLNRMWMRGEDPLTATPLINEYPEPVLGTVESTWGPPTPVVAVGGTVTRQISPTGQVTEFRWTGQWGVAPYDLDVVQHPGTAEERHTRYLHNLEHVTQPIGARPPERIVRAYVANSTTKYTEWTQDAEGFATRVTDPEGRWVETTYDGVWGEPTEVRTEVGTTTFTYRNLAWPRLIERVDHPDGTSDEFDYRYLTEPGLGGQNYVTDVLLDRVTRIGRCPDDNPECVLRPTETTDVHQEAGGLTRWTVDPSGSRTCFEYDVYGRPTRTILAANADCTASELGVELRTEYDWRGYLVATTDARGVRTQYVRRADGRVRDEVLDPGGLNRVTRYTYDAWGWPTRVTADLGADEPHVWQTEYAWVSPEGLVRPTRMRDPLGREILYTYDGYGEVRTITGVGFQNDGSDRVTTQALVPTGTGWQATVTLHDGRVLTEMRNAVGQPVETVDARGVRRTYTYDGAGRVRAVQTGTTPVTDASGEVSPAAPVGTGVEYDEMSRVVERHVLEGVTTVAVERFEYDEMGRLFRATNANGEVTERTYDVAARTERVTTGVGTDSAVTVETWSDALGRLSTSTLAPDDVLQARTTRFEYDATGVDPVSLRRRIDASGQVRTYGYHRVFGGLETLQMPEGVWQYAYDRHGRVTLRQDPLGRGVEYGYDRLNRMISRTEDAGTEAWRYWRDGTLRSYTDLAGRVTQYGYDATGRRTWVWYPGTPRTRTPSVTFGYLPNDLLATVDDGSGRTEYAYDASNRMRRRMRGGHELTYAYDALGLTEMGYDGLGSVLYDRVGGDRVTHVGLWGQGLTARYGYTNDGRLETVEHAAGLRSRRGYAGETRDLTSLTYSVDGESGEEEVEGVAYLGFDELGRPTEWNDRLGTTRVRYDAMHRLERVVYPNVPGTPSLGTVNYGYDPMGNMTEGDRARPVDERTDRFADLPYDAAGNLESDGEWSFTYDGRNRLMRSERESTSTVVEYHYDGLDQLVGQSVNGRRTDFLLDERGSVARVVGLVRGGVRTLYAWGAEGLMAEQTFDAEGAPQEVRFPQVDRKGTVRGWLSAEGEVLGRLDYDVWGRVRRTEGAYAPNMPPAADDLLAPLDPNVDCTPGAPQLPVVLQGENAVVANGVDVYLTEDGRWGTLYNVDGGDSVSFGVVTLPCTPGNLVMRVRLATPNEEGNRIVLHLDGVPVASLVPESTGSFDGEDFEIQTTLSTARYLGAHEVSLVFEGGLGVGNIDWLELGTTGEEAPSAGFGGMCQ